MTEANKIKILLIDDDKFLLDMYVMKFKANGNIEIETISSSINALAKIKEGFIPDVIILDIIMPTMDGLELLQKIRDEKLAPNAVIIMLTNQPDETKRAEELGVAGYIVKASTIPSEVVAEVLDIYKKHKT